jgi:transposase
MGFIQGEGRNPGTLFPVMLDDLVPGDHIYRVIDAFVQKLEMEDIKAARRENQWRKVKQEKSCRAVDETCVTKNLRPARQKVETPVT